MRLVRLLCKRKMENKNKYIVSRTLQDLETHCQMVEKNNFISHNCRKKTYILFS